VSPPPPLTLLPNLLEMLAQQAQLWQEWSVQCEECEKRLSAAPRRIKFEVMRITTTLVRGVRSGGKKREVVTQ